MLAMVYGTLKKHHPNHGVMESAGGKFIGNALSRPEFDMVDFGPFPGIVPGNFRITGEVYQVENIMPLDVLEGHPDLYKREQIYVTGVEAYPFDKAEWRVWAYIYQGYGRHVFPDDSPNIQVVDDIKTWLPHR